MRVAAMVFAAVLMAAPAAFAQTETPAPEVTTETVAPETTTPTSEEAPSPEPTETAAEATPAPSEERVCRSGPRSESRLRTRERICRTQAEWDAFDRARSRTGAN
jgi:hypothetical protein